MTHTEYRVIHNLRGVKQGIMMPSKKHAEKYIRVVEKHLEKPVDWKLQSRTVTEWEEVE